LLVVVRLDTKKKIAGEEKLEIHSQIPRYDPGTTSVNSTRSCIINRQFISICPVLSSMPVKRQASDSGSSLSDLSPPPEKPRKKAKASRPKSKSKSKIPAPTDEFQQVSKSDFVDRYRVDGLDDVFYQADVRPLPSFGPRAELP
jgi:hypothetical protein